MADSREGLIEIRVLGCVLIGAFPFHFDCAVGLFLG